LIIDCHTHIAQQMTGFWRPRRYGRVFDQGAERQAFPPSFDPVASPAEVLVGYMDWANVDRAFLVQHHMYGDQNQTVLDAVRRWPDRFVGFAYLGAFDQPDTPDLLERLIDMGMTGLKVELQSTQRLRPTFRFDGDLEMRVWERLDQIGRPWILDINEATAEDLVRLRTALESLKRSRFVICHIGWPATTGWQERALVAKHPRGWADLASLPHTEGPEAEYPWPGAQANVRWAVEQFGADRVMWGTDYPGALNAGTYRQHVDYIRRHCDFLSADQKALLLGGAAEGLLAGL
jgi:predicted TIM-barrel fold metal-dependent hydrolase